MRPIIFTICFLLLLLQGYCAAAEFLTPRRVDERRAAQVGLRKIVGRHLRLYTDLPPSDAVDQLATVFDAAVPLWAEYFKIDLATLRDWQMQGYLMQDRAKFAALGLLPKDRTDFANGYCNGYELWLVEQPSDYFRRHLLLHEGTHGLMYTQLGAPGAGWYMEGMAELLGTHRLSDERGQTGKLKLGTMPIGREEVPMWGRIRLIRDAVRSDEILKMAAIMNLDNRRAFSTREYAWCWALCKFFDAHPRWQTEFRALRARVSEPRFNKRVRYEMRAGWSDLQAEWDAYVATLDYGYDAERMAMLHCPAMPVTDEVSISVDAARGWQSTGWQVEAGLGYQVTAAGRYEIARETNEQGEEIAWPCEPGGVTLEYHEGRPLGMLLGAWRETENDQFSESFAIGLKCHLEPPANAVLYVRVNDSAARLSDNRGTLSASIRQADD